MKPYHFLLIAGLIITSCIISYAQEEPHVRSTYLTSVNVTVIETDVMYLTDTPAQFVQVFLRSSYKGEKLNKSPDKILLTILSTSQDVLYELDWRRNLAAVTDGKSWGLGEVRRLVMWGEAKNGKEVFSSVGAPAISLPPEWGFDHILGGKPGTSLNIIVPQNAKVRRGKSINGLVTEYMQILLRLDQVVKMANAGKLKLQLGGKSFEFNDEQLTTTRDFAGRIKPASRP